jgi:Peptidase family M41
VAYHEDGHALVTAVLPEVDPLYKVTIMPRGRSLGVTQFRPEDDRRNLPRTYLIERLAVVFLFEVLIVLGSMKEASQVTLTSESAGEPECARSLS